MRATEASRDSLIETKQAHSDEWLLVMIGNGDESALEALIVRHNTRLHRFVLRIVKSPSICEEVVSDVFLYVWRGARSFEARSRVSTWLTAIARHRALEALRRRTEKELDPRWALAIADEADTPEEAVTEDERNVILRSCLDQLPPAHREILDLFYMREMSVSDIVRLKGIPAATVKTRMFYARGRMAELLGQRGVVSAWQ